MKAAIAGIVVVLGLVFAIAAFLFSYNNMGNDLEQQIVAIQQNSMNVASQYQNLVFEAAQVPEMQRDDLKEVITAALEGRYGDNGSQAVFQAIQEDNPQIDSTVYVKLQQIMESGRKDFQREQTRMIEAVKVYKTKLGNMPSGFFLGLMGYPKINLEEFRPVTTERVRGMFETGNEEHWKLR